MAQGHGKFFRARSLVARLEGEWMLITSIGEMQDIKERYARGRD
ncbi:MAG TPA: hypothetical protein VGI28_07280 [Stellaceae bacterium]